MTDSMYETTAVYQMLFADRDHDLPFYLDAAAACGEGAAILDYGVGAGRVALPLARAGHRVTGIDDAPAMIDALAEAARGEPAAVRARLGWHLGCARALRLDARFDLVICPFNGFAHHHDEEAIAAFLAAVRDHLRPGGRFAFDVLLPSPALMAGMVSHVPWFRHPALGVACRATEEVHYDAATEILSITTTVRHMEAADRADEVYRLVLRQHRPETVGPLLARHGLAVLATRDLGDVLGLVCARR